jgi:hypothetical protein
MQSLVLNTQGETVTAGELLDAIGRRAHGPVLLLLGFVAISPLTIIPGASWLVAALTLVFALQVAIGLRHPWVPGAMARFSFRREHLVRGAAAGERYAHMLDALVRPRLVMLTAPPFLQLAAVLCVLAALMTFPLGLVPFGPVLPGLTILLFGLAITARDGVVLLFSIVAFAGAGLLFARLAPRLAGIWPF